MKIIKQAILVLVLLQIGNLISKLISPIILIPGSIIGMILLFTFLLKDLIKLDHIEELSSFLLKHMGFFFIPLGVSLLNSVDLLKAVWVELAIVLLVSCFLVMFVSSKVTDIMIQRTKKGRYE